MSNAAIRIALERRLNSLPSPVMPIAWENVNYTPLRDVPFISTNLLFATPDDIGYKDNPFIQRGYLQVTLHFPTNVGPGPAQQAAEKIRLHFFRGLSVTANSITTVIERTPEITGGSIEDDRYVIRVRIRFYAEISYGAIANVPDDFGSEWVTEAW